MFKLHMRIYPLKYVTNRSLPSADDIKNEAPAEDTRHEFQNLKFSLRSAVEDDITDKLNETKLNRPHERNIVDT